MSPSGQKRACQSVPVDILSILPDKAIDNILMRLPLREAVRTSILAKTWRYIWCRLPQLELDESLWNLSQSSDPTPRFKDIVYHFLTLHEGPVTKFTFSIPNLKSYPKLDNLIYFLSRNDIQHLVLELPPVPGDRYKLPSSIFTCLQLRNLTLESCLIPLPPSAFKGFDKLISLELSYVKIPSKFLKSLISSCPLLDKLVLRIAESSYVIEINAPMLKSFHFFGDIRCICLKTIPRLSKLSLWCCEYLERSGKFDIAKFFEPISGLDDLHLDNHCVEFLARAGGAVSKRLPFDLNCVKHLYLHCSYLGKLDIISCAFCLIRSFPCLQYMEIQVVDYNDNNIPALECLEVEAFSDVIFDHLREVKLRNTVGSKREMQLIKLLLAKSPVLVKMVIEASWFVKTSATIKILKELTKFQRASPKAEVVYR
ncbi:F-box/FBD/LRR-repeat protein At1g13570-like [Lycium barbarum]|uniref:F-box/FBD/LRR-repeat protein At1g13570-like n=1 Tax=Lycium barbarum TaxID=112863 RepID=UPI00293E4B68|nr:F-box/FBD/LRR-repeat protein At1g13570-like [Lycium barbarum]XP_060214963.1 F-box/FBD/LRR-repeat protein At1g13570-like [Lycium barbarum]XP_060214964.1 F-box/FBD/LRR-repeat protein At1g13570-like [Lycium barbarum]